MHLVIDGEARQVAVVSLHRPPAVLTLWPPKYPPLELPAFYTDPVERERKRRQSAADSVHHDTIATSFIRQDRGEELEREPEPELPAAVKPVTAAKAAARFHRRRAHQSRPWEAMILPGTGQQLSLGYWPDEDTALRYGAWALQRYPDGHWKLTREERQQWIEEHP